MRIYIITTGAIFALLTVVHIWRAFIEQNLATDPFFIGVTVAAALLAVWAGIVLRRSVPTGAARSNSIKAKE